MNLPKRFQLVVILDDPQSRFLVDLVSALDFRDSVDVHFVDLQKLRLQLRTRVVRFLLSLLRKSHGDPQELAYASVLLRRCRCEKWDIVLGLDNQLGLISKVSESSLSRKPNCFVIQLGTNPKYYDATSRAKAKQVAVTMFCWGSREPVGYVRRGLVPRHFVVVGSLKCAISRRRTPSVNSRTAWDLCIVSQFRSLPIASKYSESSLFEAASMPRLIQLLRPAIDVYGLKVVVALKAGRGLYEDLLERQEINFFQSTIGDVADVIVSQDGYASYEIANNSKLVVGRNSSLLYEVLDTSSKVLFINPTQFNRFDAPSDLPFRLSMPGEAMVTAAVSELLQMDKSEYDAKIQGLSSKYCIHNEQALDIVKDHISRAVEMVYR